MHKSKCVTAFQKGFNACQRIKRCRPQTHQLLRTVLGGVYKPLDGCTAGVLVLNHCNGCPVQTLSGDLRMPAKYCRGRKGHQWGHTCDCCLGQGKIPNLPDIRKPLQDGRSSPVRLHTYMPPASPGTRQPPRGRKADCMALVPSQHAGAPPNKQY